MVAEDKKPYPIAKRTRTADNGIGQGEHGWTFRRNVLILYLKNAQS